MIANSVYIFGLKQDYTKRYCYNTEVLATYSDINEDELAHYVVVSYLDK